jgi:hypothetical protein
MPAGWRSASYLAGTALTEIGNRRVGQMVQLAARCIALDLLIEMRGLEFFEPGETGRTRSGRVGLRLFNISELGHKNIMA